MTKRYDTLVFIGRFQPFHNGHLHVIKTALANADQVIVLVGGANRSRCPRNPFTYTERRSMILRAVDNADVARLEVVPLNDHIYNELEWIEEVQTKVDKLAIGDNIGLIGHAKDSSCYYLKLFPRWGNIDVQSIKDGQHVVINATDIRQQFFSPQWADQTPYWASLVPERVADFMHTWFQAAPDVYQQVLKEQSFVQKYKQQWKAAPYPPTFVTVDSVVVQSGHILLVERKADPGAGKLALPGGFINQDERLLDSAIRELREETGIKVPEPVLRGSLKAERTFDDPHRSSRGRTITTAFLFLLTPMLELPRVKGGDDAANAFWMPLSELTPEVMFEDHYFMIQAMTASL